MADVLLYSQNTFKPRLVVDVATISKNISKTIGQAATGVFTNSDTIWKQLRKASAMSGDRVWRFPLWKHFSREVKNYTSVDMSNRGVGTADTCLAAAFLKVCLNRNVFEKF